MEPLAIHGIGAAGARRRASRRALEDAGLAPAERYWDRYPHELSGGQRQRVVIAAAMALRARGPDLRRARLGPRRLGARAGAARAVDLQAGRGLGLIFITHDLGLAWALCDRIAVMYLGRIVERGRPSR